MSHNNSIFIKLFFVITIISCSDKVDYKQDLLSNDKVKIIKASYKLGEIKDSTAVKILLRNALDPRITHVLKFYGTTVNYNKLVALQKISNNAYNNEIKQHEVDTIATLFFRDWAIQNGYFKNKSEIDINYYKQ